MSKRPNRHGSEPGPRAPVAVHQLPFGAKMTDKLFRLAQRPPDPALHGSICLPSIVWGPQIAKAGWLLAWIPTCDTEPDRLFQVDGVTFYLSTEVEPLMYDQVFDWEDNSGVVLRAA